MRHMAWLQVFGKKEKWKRSKEGKEKLMGGIEISRKKPRSLLFCLEQSMDICSKQDFIWEKTFLCLLFLNLLIFCLDNIYAMLTHEEKPIRIFFKLSKNKLEEFSFCFWFSNGNHALVYHQTKETEILNRSKSIYLDSATSFLGILWLNDMKLLMFNSFLPSEMTALYDLIYHMCGSIKI